MRNPSFLKPNEKIGIVATARKISLEEIQVATNKFNEWGLEVLLGENLFHEDHQYSGTDAERTSDLQQMLDDDSVRAIVIARGGYGTVRIIDHLNFDKFIKNPKWIIGYSDVTALHSHIHQQFNIQTLHATMPLNFPADGKNNNALHSLKKALFGEAVEYTVKPHVLNRMGKASGILTGGNLSLLYALSGTPSDISTEGKILFIEDLDEYLYHIDRMMMNLKRSGKLSHLKALIVGGMTEMRDNTIPFGKEAYQIIAEAVAGFDYPVLFDFPAGHIEDNRALILGGNCEVEINKELSTLRFIK